MPSLLFRELCSLYNGGDDMLKVYVVPDPNETKFQRFKREAKAKAQELWQWVKNHKEEILLVTPLVIGGTTTIIKVVGKHVNLRKQEAIKDLYCYDRSLGHYWKLSRELTNSEWIEIERRRKAGERLADILANLKVLA